VLASPAACFYVLRDHPVLDERQITDPHVARSADGSPDVEFGFTPPGVRAFGRVTAEIAHRGAAVSSLGESLNQHFAVALDTRLVTVPSIDFHTYPHGISGSGGADIVAGFTPSSARDFAILLRYGPLPVSLQLR
jgi:preprotein translocase subunit SecD